MIIPAMSIIYDEISWWDISVVQVKQVIKLIQVMQVRLAHLSLDFRVILIESNKSNDTEQVRPMGYKTCHHLNSSLDSTVCAKDCDRQKKGKFAAECKVSISLTFLFWFWFSKDKGGLWKCCIRRDAAFCHECRWKNSNATILWRGQVLLHSCTVHFSKDV